ncbi:hypothetical protein AKJ61_02700 [candidate division MSBL1 archaeon SCGC-AAA259B11]|uniref:Uncharacterized protein n=1 Tax=candidate division MSBL1 archaeon SCGC-AAA259B11 TaxID=1698260 RepID=A0A133U5R2_9EURY|nr:hypothetical protein AKJ61_02700 [candidate division MSBL1 archaeon SCGC-AAA259B11]
MELGLGETVLADKIEEGNEKFYLGLFGEFRASYDTDSSGKPNGFRERWKRDKLFEKYGGWKTDLDFWDDGALEDMSVASVERLEEMPEEWFPVLGREAERRLLKKRNLDTLPREKFTYRSIDDVVEDLESKEAPSPGDYEGAFELLEESQYLSPAVARVFSYTSDPNGVFEEYGSGD